MATPRSILKRPTKSAAELPAIAIPPPDVVYGPAAATASTPRARPNSVRFPPSPTLTRTFSVHSAAAYDRSPIVVVPNSCALPARGCPGRTYHPGSLVCQQQQQQQNSSRTSSPNRIGKHSHPAAFSLPALIPDVSSESDESDGIASPPPPPPTHFSVPAIYAPPEPLPALSLSFLPHPSALYRPPSDERQYHTYEDDKDKDKQRRRRERDHKSHRSDGRRGARSRERTTAQGLARGTEGDAALEEDDDAEDDDIAGSGSRYKTLSERSVLSGCGFDDGDDGCLGGF